MAAAIRAAQLVAMGPAPGSDDTAMMTAALGAVARAIESKLETEHWVSFVISDDTPVARSSDTDMIFTSEPSLDAVDRSACGHPLAWSAWPAGELLQLAEALGGGGIDRRGADGHCRCLRCLETGDHGLKVDRARVCPPPRGSG
jgi:hypothetical protein